MADNLNIGSKLYICATAQNSNLTEAQFEALTWIEVTKIVSLPPVGMSVNMVDRVYVAEGIGRSRKGVLSGSDGELVVGYDYTDAGQDALYTASQSRSKYAFKLVGVDSPNTATTTNTIMYFRALVGPRNYAGGEAEGEVTHAYQIKITDQSPIAVEPEDI